jgi:Putative transposase/Transposase zinc-binding domain
MSLVDTLQQKLFGHPCIKQFNTHSQAVFMQLNACHTNRLGKHVFACKDSSCTYLHYQYHSCGNRHCPNCGGFKQEEWIEQQTEHLLPTPYYHIVFTLPQELNSLILGNRKLLFNLLFEASSAALLTLSADKKYLGAKPCITTVLHTWGQDLCFHPHVHCIVSGGGVDVTGKWIHAKRVNEKFLFPKPVLQKVFKAIYLKKLKLLKSSLKLQNIDLEKLIETIGFKKWNVFLKAPFAGPSMVINYLGRYTHKIAITKHRIKSIDESTITFSYKDYKAGGIQKIMTLEQEEFLRRFELHILPRQFCKIRHFGALSNKNKRTRLTAIRLQLELPKALPYIKLPAGIRLLEKKGIDIRICPICKMLTVELIATFRYSKSFNKPIKNVHSPP